MLESGWRHWNQVAKSSGGGGGGSGARRGRGACAGRRPHFLRIGAVRVLWVQSFLPSISSDSVPRTRVLEIDLF
jgi:hypothetical protein